MELRGQSLQRTGNGAGSGGGGEARGSSNVAGASMRGGTVETETSEEAGQSTALTCRGLSVVADSWHCARRGQGRQSHARAPYTMRTEPLRSGLRSCTVKGRS